LAQQINESVIDNTQLRFRKTDACFDWLEHVVKRFKSLLVDIGALAFLIYELVRLIDKLSSG